MILIAGPCVIESRDHTLRMAEKIVAIGRKYFLPEWALFKASWDKANRSSHESYRGLGLHEGLRILEEVKTQFGLKVTTDIHEGWQAAVVAEVADLIQIPALLCRQTDLIQDAARTGKPINIKKGQFMSPYQMKDAVGKAQAAGAESVMVTERGTMFGYGNLIVDMRSLIIMRDDMPGVDIILDATHSTNGDSRFAAPLARAAGAIGIDGLFVECHDDPDNAKCDGSSMLTPEELDDLLQEMQ